MAPSTPYPIHRLTGQLTYAALVGTVGSVIIVLFLLSFVHIFGVIRTIPFVAAFNALVSGYVLMERTRNRLPRWQIMALAVGVANAVLTYGALQALALYFLGKPIVNGFHFAILVAIGAVCGRAGAWLAHRYFQMTETS